MKALNIILGVLLAAVGIFALANAGLSFVSMAFPIGIILVLVGLFESLGYKTADDDEEDRHWVLIDGITTVVLGVVVITGQLAADVAVIPVFGMWAMISGIRNLVIMTQVKKKEEKDRDFYWDLVVSILNLVVGLYCFFNFKLFNLAVLALIGVIFVIQGVNVIKIGTEMKYKKPDLIKTKDEMVEEAEEKALKARKEAREAVKRAREAKRAIKEAEEAKTFEEIINQPIGDDNVEI